MKLHVLLNTSDKLKSGAPPQALARYRRQRSGHLTVQLFSARSGLGVEGLLEVLNEWLGHR